MCVNHKCEHLDYENENEMSTCTCEQFNETWWETTPAFGVSMRTWGQLLRPRLLQCDVRHHPCLVCLLKVNFLGQNLQNIDKEKHMQFDFTKCMHNASCNTLQLNSHQLDTTQSEYTVTYISIAHGLHLVSVWRSSLKTGKRPRPDGTRTDQDWKFSRLIKTITAV